MTIDHGGTTFRSRQVLVLELDAEIAGQSLRGAAITEEGPALLADLGGSSARVVAITLMSQALRPTDADAIAPPVLGCAAPGASTRFSG
jgi:hexokinase